MDVLRVSAPAARRFLVQRHLLAPARSRTAGLDEKDVIMRINGQSVTAPWELSYIIDHLDIGDDIDLAVRKNGGIQHIRATLGARP